MITFSKEVGELMPGIVGLIFAFSVWFIMKREHRKMRAAYFTAYGRYPGEAAPKHAPAE
ncbi:MAG: hypothetical protein WDN24_05345 [Sphingomonas sp.]